MADISFAAIKAVRSRCDAGIAEAKAALVATGGDVDAAVERLITPERRALDAHYAITLAVAAKGASPPREVRVHRVTIDPAAAELITTLAPELERFMNAMAPGCRLITLERRWDRFADGTSQLAVGADFAALDPDPARDHVIAVLGAQDLTRLPDDRERGRAAFEDRAGTCLRTWVRRDDSLRVVLRVEALCKADDAVGGAMLTPALAAYARTTTAARGSSMPAWVRARWDVDEGGARSVDAVFISPVQRVMITDRGGVLTIESLA